MFTRHFFWLFIAVSLLWKVDLPGGCSYLKGGGFIFEEGERGYSVAMGSRYPLGPFNAFDVAWQGMWVKGSKDAFFATPRGALLFYLNPCHSFAFYAGGAVSWAHTIDLNEFSWRSGLQLEGLVGLEIGHNSGYLVFIELSKSYPKFCGFGRKLQSTHRHFTTISLAIGF